MRVYEHEVRELLAALGASVTANSAKERIKAKVQEIHRWSRTVAPPEDERLNKLYQQLVSSARVGEEIEFLGEGTVLTEVKPDDKPIRKGKGKGKDKTKGRVGVLKKICDLVCGASEGDPITKEQIWKALCVAFPDRDPEKMWGTIEVTVPGRLLRLGYDVGRKKVGREPLAYWVRKKD